jgi:5,10-methylenetetrahydrofolate reductase
MIAEGKKYAETLEPGTTMRFGAASGLRPVPEWKRAADFLIVQIGFSVNDLVRWRSQVDLSIPVYAGVILLASATMGRRLGTNIPGLEVPGELVDRLEKDRNAGVDAACELVERIRESGALDGVHLIPVTRYREVAARLEETRAGRRS